VRSRRRTSGCANGGDPGEDVASEREVVGIDAAPEAAAALVGNAGYVGAG
jgi:hypothetical protein